MFTSASETLQTTFEWPENVRLHEDNTFGHLTLDAGEINHFTLKYEGFEAHFEHHHGIKLASSGSLPERYFFERIATPFLRLLNGYLLLHASALSTPRGGIVMLAPSGVGKSTIAASLLEFPDIKLIADDITTISSGTIYPLSSQIAMRHDMANSARYVESIESNGYKRLLNICPEKIEHEPVPIQSLCLLESTGHSHPLSFSDSLPKLFAQQLKLSNPPPEFTRAQFRALFELQSIPCLKFAISCQNKDDVHQSARLIFETLQTINSKSSP